MPVEQFWQGFVYNIVNQIKSYETIRQTQSKDVDHGRWSAATYCRLFQDLTSAFFFLSAFRKDKSTFSSWFSDVSVPSAASLFTFFR